MTKRMLIDAAHPEETRVVIVDGTRVEELDFESRHKRQLRGNVYLAKVTRVEPSLQAAFIDYGGNRHGFLAFSEIHPDYYQIPYEDKLALQEEEEELAEASDDDDEDVDEDENLDPDESDTADENDAEVADEQVKVASRRRKHMRRRRYKIQEVIKRGQILLVQAVKEERGNKGAAMTTYLSLAGRYCVLMPNTPRGGGISRKIANGEDRKRLKNVMSELSVPQGMGVIVRTAGAKRTKAEISRDYGYLSRLWDDIRDMTLKSVAPTLVHEEGNLVKRSIRDLYNKEIEEVLVQGDEAYKTAKSFIKMLMPSHAKFVQRYEEDIPLFLRFDVERQIENSLDATVQLKSGGYLVIHPTEALVSVDVNSGKSTKERNVERTALKTNLEAAEELARQMRLRDLAGLIVVDFIDMDESKNNRAVERKVKDVLSQDRARIQTSRISQFGLMEISRQRRRRSLLEGSTTVCSHCDGVGRKRTIESAALAAIRAVEEFAIRGKAKKIRLKCPPDVALYLLNEKRDLLTKVDEDADVFTIVEHDDDLIRPAFIMEVAEKRSDGRKDPLVEIAKDIEEESKRSEQSKSKAKSKPKTDTQDKSDDEDESDADTPETSDDGDDDSKPRRRRGRRGGRNRNRRSSEADSATDEAPDLVEDIGEDKDSEAKSDSAPRSRRRRRKRKPSETQTETSAEKTEESQPAADAKTEQDSSKRRSSARRKAPSRDKKTEDTGSETSSKVDEPETKKAPERKSQEKKVQDDSKPTRRRKAPSRSKTAEKSDSEETPKPKSRRRAPAKAKAKDEDKTEASAASKTPAGDKKADSSSPARRRKAPARAQSKDDGDKAEKTTASSEDAPKPARRRKAAPKAKTADTESKSDQAEAKTAKPARRRKAPAKKAAPAQKTDSQTAKSKDDTGSETPKPKRRRAAPKKKPATADKKVTEKGATEKQTPQDQAKAESKPVRRRKAPAKKSPAAASSKEPAKQPETAQREKPAQETPQPAEQAEDTGRRRKAPPKRKRNLIDRLMGKE